MSLGTTLPETYQPGKPHTEVYVRPLFVLDSSTESIIKNLGINFDTYFNDCCDAIIMREDKTFQDNYLEMNQTISFIEYLVDKFEISDIGLENDIRKKRQEMYFLRTSKARWDDITGVENTRENYAKQLEALFSK